MQVEGLEEERTRAASRSCSRPELGREAVGWLEDLRLWRVGDATGGSTAVELGGLGAPTTIPMRQAPAYFFEGS